MTQHLQRHLQNHFPEQDGLLLARVGADRIEQSSLSIGQGQLHGVATNKSRIRVHVESSITVDKWVSAFDAALRGLPGNLRGDQCLVHGLCAQLANAILCSPSATHHGNNAEQWIACAEIDNCAVQEQKKNTADQQKDPEDFFHSGRRFLAGGLGSTPVKAGTQTLFGDAANAFCISCLITGYLTLTQPVRDCLLGHTQ